ncbi:MAG: sensor histidine kinase [Balneola sp.]
MREQQEIIVKQSDLNLKLQKARLRELELKMNPEIIYPNLSFIRNKAEKNPELASQMVISMAGILRKLVDNFDHEQAMLSDENNLFKRYAELLKLRLERSFEIKVELAPGIEAERVPSLILMVPLFEELFFGEYEKYFHTVNEMFFQVKRISESEFEVNISIKNILDAELLSGQIKDDSTVNAIRELLENLRDGTFVFEPEVEGLDLMLKLTSHKQLEESVYG